jgi:hypothetical protein
MSDPIEELRRFDAAGVDVAPLPAAEVRRRGDRRRRRTAALATAGGVAAVAALVIPLALAAGGTDRSELQPIAPSPSTSSATAVPGLAPRQRIPADFDLTALPAAATFSFAAQRAPAIDELSLCGRTVFATGPDAAVPVVDSAGASYAEAGTSSSSNRTLALYADADAAAEALDAIEAGVRACPVQRQDPGAPLVHDAVDTELPTDESFVFTQQARMGGGLLADLTVFQVARVGNALYVATTSTSAGGPQVVDAEVRRMAESSAPVLSDLCTFAADRC